MRLPPRPFYIIRPSLHDVDGADRVSVQGLSITLSAEQITALEAAAPFEWGFPYEFFGRDPALTNGVGGIFVQMSGHTKFVLAEQPIKPGPVASELQAPPA